MEIPEVNVRLLITLIPGFLFSAYYIVIGKPIEAILVFSLGTMLTYGFHRLVLRLRKPSAPSKIDENLTNVLFHMYSLSLGETSPSDLVETVAESKEYGFYSKIFRKIRKLAVDLGYGYTRATAKVANIVKPPLKDVLIRCTTIFGSTKPRGYLEIEASTSMEEYSGRYNRAIETIRTLAGIFTTFQSVTVFLILTMAIMSIFMIDPTAIGFGYVMAILSLILMYYLFRVIGPKENFVYISDHPPRLYNLMKWCLIATLPSSIIMAATLYLVRGVAFAFIALGLGVLIPGIFGYKLEKYVKRIENSYPTFMKALGESLASTSDLKMAFEYLLYMELGPLHKLVKRALARLKLGLSHKKVMEILSSEATSYQAHISNKMMIDALERGADPLEVGNALGNRGVKFLELKKKREAAARNFQTITLIMQCMSVVLLIVLKVMGGFLSSTLVNLPYFALNALPMNLIEIGNVVLITTMAVVNALIVKETSSGYWGTFLLNLALLFVLSGIAWVASEMFISAVLKSMPTIELPA